MTLFGWDASHFDGLLSRAILGRARAEGIDFFTHKLGEGLNDTEGTLDDTALAAARDAGIPYIGGYLIPRTNATPAAQVARWVQLADAGEPWWRTFPGWFWQVDLERWSYDNVPASVGIDCARRLRDATGRAVVLYASHGQYWDDLAPWDGPLWNADYVSAPAAGFRAMYPGDGWQATHKDWAGGWAPYSGKVPAILQFTSSATIAGLTTCDANAFRGTVADFAALIGAQKPGGDSMGAYRFMLNDAGPDGLLPSAVYLGTPGGGWYWARSDADFEGQNLAAIQDVGPFARAQAEHIFGPYRSWTPQAGPAGPKGDPGDPGAPGKDGAPGQQGDAAVLAPNSKLIVSEVA